MPKTALVYKASCNSVARQLDSSSIYPPLAGPCQSTATNESMYVTFIFLPPRNISLWNKGPSSLVPCCCALFSGYQCKVQRRCAYSAISTSWKTSGISVKQRTSTTSINIFKKSLPKMRRIHLPNEGKLTTSVFLCFLPMYDGQLCN